jgi:hypothetical protein
MSDPDYEWPRYFVGPQDHLYVLGVISLNFNLYEYSLVGLLERHLAKDVAAFLTNALTNVERSQLIRLLTGIQPGISDEIEFLLRHFAICMENRHILLHSRPS